MKGLFAQAILLVLAGSLLAAQDVSSTYAARCANCHGPDGRGNTALGRALKLRDLRSPEVKRLSENELVTIISQGADQGKMPGFEKKLGAEAARELAVYVRTIELQPASASTAAGLAKMQAKPVDAKTVYSANCSHCHGSDGSGNTALGKTLKLRDLRSPDAQRLSDQELIAVIAHGTDRGRMPGFQKRLGSDMVAQLTSYVRELGGRAPNQAPMLTAASQPATPPSPSRSAAQVEPATQPTPQPERSASAEADAQPPGHTSRLASLRSVIVPGNATAHKTELVDLNSASKETLMTLPGITEADAVSIIGARPYKSTLQFKIKNVIAPEKYVQIADRIMAKQISRKPQLSSIPAHP